MAVSINVPFTTPYELRIVATNGKVVKKIQTSVIDGKSVITVPDLSKGCYFLQMKKHSHSQPSVKMISVF